jgi:hypothetical protein
MVSERYIVYPILSSFNWIHIFISYFFKIQFNIILLHMPIAPNYSFPSGFPTWHSNIFLISPMHAACPVHLIFLYLIPSTVTNYYIIQYYYITVTNYYIIRLYSPSVFSSVPSLRSTVLNSQAVLPSWWEISFFHPYKTLDYSICLNVGHAPCK